MKKLKIKYGLLSPLVFALSLSSSFSQVPDFSNVPSLHEGDSINITYLINNGIKITAGKAICWFPKDSLSEQRMTEIASMINTGIHAAEKFINAPLPWQLHQPSEPYTLYFRFDRFVSHASLAGFVCIPFWRIKEGKSPWLHEIMHEMLDANTGTWFSKSINDEEFNKNFPHWLSEGLPDYISLTVSLSNHLPWFDVFSNSNLTNIDSLFKKEMGSEKGTYILSFIGTKGVMPELSSKDRILYAPAFYHGSSSFTRYLADNYGLKILLKAFSSFKKELETIENLTGKTLDVLKKEWLAKLILR